MRGVIITVCMLCLVLSVRFFFHYSTKPEYQVGKNVELHTTLLREPRFARGQQIITLEGLTVFVPRSTELEYGDEVKVSGIVTSGKTDDQKILDQVEVQKITTIQTPLLAPISGIRSHMIKTFSRYLPSREAGLLLGIVFGVREGIDKGFYEELRDTGVLHVVAASGSNVVLVGGFMLGILSFFLRRQVAIIGTVGCLVFYALISGLDASIVRATLMGSFTYGTMLLGRQSLPLLSLFFACFLMLILNPETLFDVGFQLSAASTFGILTLKPALDRMFSRLKKIPLINDFTTTLAAQGFSLPVLLISFSSYSFYSILVNVLIIWTVPILMILGGIAALVSVIPMLSAPVLYLAYPFLWLFVWVVEFFARITSPVEVEYVPYTFVMGYLLLVALIASKKRPHL